MNAPAGAVDYWCNAFTPDRRDVWERAITDQDLDVFCAALGDALGKLVADGVLLEP